MARPHRTPGHAPPRASTSSRLVATAYFAHSARLLARTADVLEEKDDATRYHALADAVREAFRALFHAGGGRLTEQTQTAYALALVFRPLDDDTERAVAGGESGVPGRGPRPSHRHRIPLATSARVRRAHRHRASRHRPTGCCSNAPCPSWLYQVDMGATTVWERWDALLPGRQRQPQPHDVLQPLRPRRGRRLAPPHGRRPGPRRTGLPPPLLIRPRPGGTLTWAEAAHETPYGRAETKWRTASGELRVEVLVPGSTTATVHLPGTEPVDAGPGRHTFHCPFPADREGPTSR
ncbi:alpha-L-rhamnosidase C-terminal domain-containing protein [Streptomyces sp. L7]